MGEADGGGDSSSDGTRHHYGEQWGGGKDRNADKDEGESVELESSKSGRPGRRQEDGEEGGEGQAKGCKQAGEAAEREQGELVRTEGSLGQFLLQRFSEETFLRRERMEDGGRARRVRAALKSKGRPRPSSSR